MLVILSCAAACRAQAPFPEAPFVGRPIASIRYVPDTQPYPLSFLDQINPVKTGDIFDPVKISGAIERLYETGRFYTIDVDAELLGEEVIVEFHTTPTWFVGGVAVNGASDPPNSSQLIAASRLELGQDFGEDYLLESSQNMLSLLRNNGFNRATVNPRFAYDDLTQQVNLAFDIETGRRARFTAPVITGDATMSAKEILRATRWQRLWGLAGFKHATESRVQSGLEKIRYSFQSRDFLMAKVALKQLEFLPETNRVRPHIEISSGPRISIRTTGARLSRSRLRSLVPVFQERAVDRDLLVEGNRDITRYLQSKGYFDAAVDFTTAENAASGERTIVYTIERGSRYKLVHLDVKGNDYFDDETILERLSITPATRLRYRNGRFSEEMLRRDIEAIEFLYRSNGFRDAVVNSRVERNYKGHEADVAVFLTIEEGGQWTVASVDISGVDLRDFETVKGLMRTIEGQPYSEANLASDRDGILNFYFNNGFPDATLEFKTETLMDSATVNVKLTVAEGRRNFVRRILVDGYRTTRPRLIFDRIPIATGDPISQSAIVEAQRRLYDLGIFAKVDIALQNPEGRERDRNVLYRLEEASRYSYTLGFGAQLARIGGGLGTFNAPAGAPGFSPRVSLGVTRSNFMGFGHTIGASTYLSAFQKKVLANYYAPQFTGNDKLSLSLTSLFDISRDIRTFEAQRLEGSVQLSQKVSKASTFQYRYTYRRVSIDQDTLVIDPELIPLFSIPIRVGIVSASAFQDKRDDPINSTRGMYHTIDGGVASQYFGSESNFLRMIYRNSTYHRVGKDMVLARLTTFGSMYSRAGDNLAKDVPLPERFFAGGAHSHRGFPDNQAGPRDPFTGFPIGGKALLINQLELRFPLIGDNLGAVVYHDMGNVYSELSRVSFRVQQKDVTDFDYMVHAAGIGIRYRTPVGPVRFDVGFSPNSPKFFGFRGTREELVAGGGIRLVQRINQLQFHFSLGQTF